MGGVAVRMDGRVGVSLVNAAPTPMRAGSVDEAAGPVDRRQGDRARRRGLDPSGEPHATPAFRRGAAWVRARRALEAGPTLTDPVGPSDHVGSDGKGQPCT